MAGSYQCRRTVMEWICSCGEVWHYFPYRHADTRELNVELMQRWFCCETCKAPFNGEIAAMRGVNQKCIHRRLSRRERRAKLMTD